MIVFNGLYIVKRYVKLLSWIQKENSMAKSKAQGKKKAPTRKAWKSFGREVYEEVMHGLVHFSAKTTNSNTPACGVRLGADHRVSLPYVAVSTIGKVPADYTSTGSNGINATVLAQISAAIDGNTGDLFDDVPPDEAAEIPPLAEEILSTPFDTGTGSIGMRLRQLIVQDADGNDQAATPLQSAGFSHVLADRIERIQNADQDQRKYYWPRSYLGIGGANPQNVGRFVRAMNRPLFFDAPTESKDIRAAHAFHHKGISLSPPQALLDGYIRWRKKMLRAGGGAMPSDDVLREKEDGVIRDIVRVIVGRAESAGHQLEAAMDTLPGRHLVAEDMDRLMRGLLIPSERTTAWVQEFAQRMHREILDARVYVDGEQQTINVGEYESARWVKIIEEAL